MGTVSANGDEEIGALIASAMEKVGDELGSARKIIVAKDNTTLIGGNGEPDETKGRVQQMRRQITEAMIADVLIKGTRIAPGMAEMG